MILWGTVVALAVLALMGCGPSATPAAAVRPVACPPGQEQAATTPVIVATATAAEPRPALPPEVRAMLQQAGTRDDACVLIVGPDARTQALSLTPRRPNGQIERGGQREALRELTLAAVEAEIGRLAAVEPGLDTRRAVADAVQAHHTATVMVVISSGLSTQEPVDLRRLGWAANGATLGAFLARERWLRQFWIDVCTGAGAARCGSVGRADVRTEPLAQPEVPLVAPPAERKFPDSATLSVQALFRIDLATLSATADGALRFVVRRALDEDLIVSITGHTDATTGDPAHNLALSRQRALAVRDRLIALGLPADRIVAAIGVGSRGHSAEEEARTPGLAEQHRKVVIGFARRPSSPSGPET